MSAKAAQKFADTALQMFPPYKWSSEQEKRWAGFVIREIQHFTDAEIERAIREMLLRRPRKAGLPSVAEAARYCAEAKKFIEGVKTLPLKPAEKPATAVYQKLADDAILGDMGRKALQEGWLGALHGWVLTHGRAPVGPEIGQCKSMAIEVTQFIDDIRRTEGANHGIRAKLMVAVANTMLEKREKLKQRVLAH